jgi:hypothetical protein
MRKDKDLYIKKEVSLKDAIKAIPIEIVNV